MADKYLFPNWRPLRTEQSPRQAEPDSAEDKEVENGGHPEGEHQGATGESGDC
jgi:hypothetical protein